MDLQVVRLFDVVDIDSIAEAVGVSPRSVIIQAEDLESAESVLLNGFPSPEFVVFAQNRLIAQVPAEIVTQQITDVFVLSNRLTLTQRSLVEFTFGSRPSSVSGILRLMQNFIRHLVRTPSTNVFNKKSGGGLLSKVGSTIGAGGGRDRAVADSVIAVNQTATYFIEVQAGIRNLAPSERLLSANVIAAQADPTNGALALSIDLVSQSGLRGVATLVR